MPADTLTISLPSPLADEVRAAAEARGVSPEEYVRQQLAWDIAMGADDPEKLERTGALKITGARAAFTRFANVFEMPAKAGGQIWTACALAGSLCPP